MRAQHLFMVVLGFSFFWLPLKGQNHPNLIMTKEGVKEIMNAKISLPIFEEALTKVKKEVDAEIASGIEVPVPKDMAGGYTHERHKLNFFILQKAGNLFQITQDEKYAIYIRDMLLAYAKLYPTLGLHPSKKSYSRGKLFWQCLNDANWLVYVSQAYDCVYDWLTAEQRDLLEKDLFRPYADFVSIGNPQFFNRIHNHSTWGNAGVGMMALVMKDEELLSRALYGLKDTDLSADSKDNDGGLVKLPGQKTAGFFAQLDHAFSPDGYYTEGPYYQRYAISPFILFAKALENNRPDLKIFEYRNGLLKKAVYALLYQTDALGEFFPINDAQKGMSFKSRELISAVNIVYDLCGRDPELLSISKAQGRVEIDQSGYAIAKGIAEGLTRKMNKKSVELKDGKDGTEGALGIIRSEADNNEITLAFKYTAQGLGHGHFDKLSYSLYDNGGEVIQDYGAARWVNIDQKAGGRYLKENKTWSKQTVGHNTLVINHKSHFKGKFEIGNEHHSDSYFFNASDPNFQIASAKENNAYPGTEMHRTMALLKDGAFRFPILIDVMRVESNEKNDYDLPLWFQGHLLNTSYDYKANETSLEVMGDSDGYQHLREEAKGNSTSGQAQISWINQGRIYSMTTASEETDELILARLGANDPKFNLRHDPCFIIRRKETGSTVFVSIIEPHGTYSPVNEVPNNPYGNVKSVEVISNDSDYTVVDLEANTGEKWTLVIANGDASEGKKHKLKTNTGTFKWKGAYHIIKQNS